MRKYADKKLFDIRCNDDSLVMLDNISLYCPVIDEMFYHVVKE